MVRAEGWMSSCPLPGVAAASRVLGSRGSEEQGSGRTEFFLSNCRNSKFT